MDIVSIFLKEGLLAREGPELLKRQVLPLERKRRILGCPWPHPFLSQLEQLSSLLAVLRALVGIALVLALQLGRVHCVFFFRMNSDLVDFAWFPALSQAVECRLTIENEISLPTS